MQNYQNKNKVPIKDLSSWEQAFKDVSSEKHWKEGRSAHSLALYFCERDGENELKQLLGLSDYTIESAEIEHESKFDNYKGRGRMQDLHMVLAKTLDQSDKVVIEIEAKVDESFGSRIDDAYTEAKKYKDLHPNSKREERINKLVTSIFGESTKIDDVKDQRYQLLYYLSGSIKEAKDKKAKKLIMPILVFKTGNYDKTIASWNKEDYKAFVERLGFNEEEIDGETFYTKEIDEINIVSVYREIELQNTV